MKTTKNLKSRQKATASTSLAVQRGSLVELKGKTLGNSQLAIVVSNDIQNESSDFLIAVPLERRAARLRAPFAVDLGRKDGLRDLHTARCDWVTRIKREQVKRIERASFPASVLGRLEEGLKVALGFDSLL